jgi:uncharacterized membrane-anchored protein YjiN (DUF445 family)
VRRAAVAALAELPGRLRGDTALAARVDAAARELLEDAGLRAVLQEVAGRLQRALIADGEPAPAVVGWVSERLERARREVLADAAWRRDLDRWLKGRLVEAVERHHGRLATFIEKGVLALGPQGAVRLIEEHAGDDLQFIRVNGTVVGGLAGGAVYGLHVLLRAW